jgi:hypothetical protein
MLASILKIGAAKWGLLALATVSAFKNCET